MDFAFSSEQKSLGESVAKVLAAFPIAPSPAYDAQADEEVWDALAGIGLFALLVPEEFGGAGLTLVDLALAVEQLGGALASPLVTHTLIATDLLVHFGEPAQKSALLPALADGKVRIALATEEQGYSLGRGEFGAAADNSRLNGRKMTVPGVELADWFLVSSAMGEPALALVARDANGLSVHPYPGLDPSAGFGEVCFHDVAAVRLPDQKAEAIKRLFDVSPAVYAGLQTGIAARMLDVSVEYARTRVQFGQAIGAFQAIKHRCADMAVALDVARSAAYYASWAVSENAPDQSRASSMAKATCGEVARDACNDAIQIHGGMGFTWELGLHRFLRRAKVLEQSFGDQAWHYERVLNETLAARDSDVER